MMRLVSAACALLFVLSGTPAAAQDNPRINVQVFSPSPHEHDLFSTMGSHVPDHLRWTVSAMLNFGKNPMVFVNKSTNERDEVIQNQLSLDIMGSLSVFGWVDVALSVPVFLYNSGQDDGFVIHNEIPVASLGDIRLSPKVKIINRGIDSRGVENDGFGLAVDLTFGFPTGHPDGFVSDGFTFVPSLIADYRIAGAHIALNLGAKIRGPGSERIGFLEVDHEFLWRLGASYEVLEQQLMVIGEVYGASSDFSQNASYVEGMIGGRYQFADEGVSLTLGGGSGFTKGYGSTKFRLFLGFMYAEPIRKDQDGDGFLDDQDKCPTEPEDFDKFEDDDGCPELDNDQDGIEDAADKCPMDKEDKDGFEDEDGCPEADNDGDGIEDGADKCPLKPEDKDGFEDEDGCPDLDNDGDGIEDSKDQCPNEPEVVNGFKDEDGCPDETKAKVVGTKIEISDKVFFETRKATIKEESHGLLRDVANLLKTNPQIKRVSIEGHTDDVGSATRNKKLSQARADAVMQFLVAEGVEASRLVAVGYGEDRPAIPEKTPEAREKNRRVEFIILEQ